MKTKCCKGSTFKFCNYIPPIDSFWFHRNRNYLAQIKRVIVQNDSDIQIFVKVKWINPLTPFNENDTIQIEQTSYIPHVFCGNTHFAIQKYFSVNLIQIGMLYKSLNDLIKLTEEVF